MVYVIVQTCFLCLLLSVKPRLQEIEIQKEVKEVNENPVCKEPWVVTDSLPMALDTDSTLPMDLSSGVPAAVGAMIQKEKEEMAALVPDTPKTFAEATKGKIAKNHNNQKALEEMKVNNPSDPCTTDTSMISATSGDSDEASPCWGMFAFRIMNH